MCKTQSLLAFVALFTGLAHSWEIAVSIGDQIEFYLNDIKMDTARLDSQNITALAYDEVHDALLYVDKQSGNDAICGYDISFRKYECYMKNSGRDIHALAFDPITQYLFFTDMKEKSINWLSLQPGSNNHVNGNLLIKLDEGIPTDIAVDSCRGYIYWINTNIPTSTIERARFDGSQREVVINAKYKMDLHSLAIEQQTKKIYWMMPKTIWKGYLYGADLNGKNMTALLKLNRDTSLTHPKALTIAKENVVLMEYCAYCTSRYFWKYPKPSLKPDNYNYLTHHHVGIYLNINNAKGEVAIAGNYKISEFEGIQECQNVTICEGPFCVHGVKVNGQSICKCTTGYTGERCDMSVCEKYCLNGNCSLDDEGLPECRCNSGYSGDRCEVSACHNYCTNNGTCSLDADGQPVCQCIDNYAGDRCEVADCQNYCFQGECTLNESSPTCRCNSGYSGDRCEVSACHNYCSNNGTCFLDAAGQPVCQCIDNYAGDRCEVADCQNYCFQGECTLNEGGPTCRCNAGYTGDRCEVNHCSRYCLNNGTCVFNEENAPSCQCIDNYVGDRCELNSSTNEEDESGCQCPRQNKNNNILSTSTVVSNLTLADLFANWRKPAAPDLRFQKGGAEDNWPPSL